MNKKRQELSIAHDMSEFSVMKAITQLYDTLIERRETSTQGSFTLRCCLFDYHEAAKIVLVGQDIDAMVASKTMPLRAWMVEWTPYEGDTLYSIGSPGV